MHMKFVNTRTAAAVISFSVIFVLGACGKKEDSSSSSRSSSSNSMPARSITPANTAPSVTTPMPDSSAGVASGAASAPGLTMASPTLPASASSAAK